MKEILFAILMIALGVQIALAQPLPPQEKPPQSEKPKDHAPQPSQLPSIREQGGPGSEEEKQRGASQKSPSEIPPLREQQEEPRGPGRMGGPAPETPATRLVRPYKASEMEGREIKSSSGESLGQIVDMIIGREGRVEFVLVSYGGFLGIGTKLVAVPYGELRQGPEQGSFIVRFDKEKIDRAPSFQNGQWPDFYDENWRRDVRTYYGE